MNKQTVIPQVVIVIWMVALLLTFAACDLSSNVRSAKEDAHAATESSARIEAQLAEMQEQQDALTDQMVQNNGPQRDWNYERLKAATELNRKLFYAAELNKNYQFQLFSGRELETDPKIEKILADGLTEFFNKWGALEESVTPFPILFFGNDANYDNLLAVAAQAHVLRKTPNELSTRENLLARYTPVELIGEVLAKSTELKARRANNETIAPWKLVILYNEEMALRFLRLRYSVLVQLVMEKTLGAQADFFDLALHKWTLSVTGLTPVKASEISRDWVYPAARTLHLLQAIGIKAPGLAFIDLKFDHSDGWLTRGAQGVWGVFAQNVGQVFGREGLEVSKKLWWCRIWNNLPEVNPSFCPYDGNIGMVHMLRNMNVPKRTSFDNGDLSILLEPTADERARLAAGIYLLKEPYE